MSSCPHCGHNHGHDSSVTYRCWETGDMVTEAYWFCHSCALIVYGTIKPKETP